MWLQLNILCCTSILISAKNLCEDNEAKSLNPVTVAKLKLFLRIPIISQITGGCDPRQISSNYFHHDEEIEFTFDKNNLTESGANIQQVNGVGVIRFQTDKSFTRKRTHATSIKSLTSNFTQGQPNGEINFSNQEMQQ